MSPLSCFRIANVEFRVLNTASLISGGVAQSVLDQIILEKQAAPALGVRGLAQALHRSCPVRPIHACTTTFCFTHHRRRSGK